MSVTKLYIIRQVFAQLVSCLGVPPMFLMNSSERTLTTPRLQTAVLENVIFNAFYI